MYVGSLAGEDAAPSRRFTNTSGGYSQLVRWLNGQVDGPVYVVLEATCVHHLPLANYLGDQGVSVLVAKPTRHGPAASPNRTAYAPKATTSMRDRTLIRSDRGLKHNDWLLRSITGIGGSDAGGSPSAAVIGHRCAGMPDWLHA